MKQQPLTVTCQACQGEGKVTLPPHLMAVISDLRKHPRSTAAQIRERLERGITVNGMYNRLKDLYDLGLLIRDRNGKFFTFSLKKEVKA